MRSSFCGKIRELPYISVDNFEDENYDKRAYFLSHCHRDHTVGLSDESFLENLMFCKAYIYASEHSAAILRVDKDYEHCANYVKSLKIGRNTVVLPGNPAENTEDVYLEVTLIPAGHCFGSVMFLFKTHCSTVLYTGDFRMHQNDLVKYEHLHEKVSEANNVRTPIKLDAMYVDTTFNNPKFQSFPKRSESVQLMMEELLKFMGKYPNWGIALHTSAGFGYEYLYKAIYEQLGQRVLESDPNMWKVYSQFPDTVSGVTNENCNNIKFHVCRNKFDNMSHDRCLKRDTNKKFLYVHLSAYIWSEYDCESLTIDKRSVDRWNVCFPTHCSRGELMYFVNYLSPKRIIGFPNYFYNEDSYDFDDKDEVVTPVKKRSLNLKGKVASDSSSRRLVL